MNEFQTQKGGRKLFNEDFDSLQKLITSAIGFFSDCGLNYVISGCEVTEDKVLSGYVFLGGKIRKVDETLISNNLRPVILPTYSTIEGKYADGTTGILREIYGTKVAEATEYYSGDCIQSVKNDIGMYSFKGVKDTFWKYYMLIRDSDDVQQLFHDVEFKQIINSINMIIKDSSKEIKIDNNGAIFTIQGSNNGNMAFSIAIPNNNSIVFIDSEKHVLPINITSNDIVNLSKLTAKLINTDSVELDKLIIYNSDVVDKNFTKEEIGNANWKRIMKVSTSEAVGNLYVRSFLNEVTIQGTIPVDFFSSVSKKDGDSFNDNTKTRYYTDYKLPAGIKAPSVPMAVAFNVISNAKGTMGANVFIDETGRFYLVENSFYRDASYDGVGQCSFPMGDGHVQISDGIPDFQDADMMSPSIVWSFFTDVPVKLYEVTRSGQLKGDIAFNAQTNTLHCWMKYYEIVSTKDLSTGKVQTEKRATDLKVANIAMLIRTSIGNKEVWAPDSEYGNYPITPKKEVVQGHNADWYDNTTWESSGYEFHTPYSSSDVKVHVTYEASSKNEYDGIPAQELLIRKSPSNYYLSVEPNYTTEVVMGAEKKVCKSVSVKSWSSSYYETKDSDGDKFGHELTFGLPYTLSDKDGALKLHTSGSFVNDIYEFTDRAINYLGKIEVTAVQSVSNKVSGISLNKRDCSIEHI